MSDHISGPRALAEPIADITDVYAFPSPERPGHLVVVMNTLPFAKPSDMFSEGLVYRFRLRPLTACAPGAPAPFTARAEEFAFDCVFSPPAGGDATERVEQEGTCTTPAGEMVPFRVNGSNGGSGHGVRVFAGARWDPFIMDAPAALKTIASGKLAFTDPGAIFLDGKNVLGLVVEIDTALLNGAPLVGVVAETLTRSKLLVRIERVGRPEVKNMMLAPKQFDPVNRDLEIRDLYNMEDAFRLADFLVVDVTKPYREQGSFFEVEVAARRGETHETCGGRALNDDVMDTIFTQLVNAGTGPIIRDGVDQASKPGSRSFPYLAPPNPHPPDRPDHH
jgi:hypothetical protein